jgi:signal transduction histidine kinase
MRTAPIARVAGSCLVILAPVCVAAQTPAPKGVLVLHQATGGARVRAQFDEAFLKAVESADAGPIEVYFETFETSRFPGPEQFRVVRDFLTNKYADLHIDVIVAEGSHSLTLARQTRERLGNRPIVAMVAAAGQIDIDDNITGLQGGFFINGTIDLALALRPDTESVVVIDGSLDHNGDMRAEVERQVKARSRPVGLVYLHDLPLTDVVSRGAAAPKHSIVLFIRQHMRTASESVSTIEALEQVVSVSPVPVFGHMEPWVGLGIIGGYTWNAEADSRRLAEMAVRIATGASVRDVPSGRNTYRTVLDWRQLQRWHVPESRLPAGSIVLFRQPSFFDQYRRYVVFGLLIFTVQLALIGLLAQRIGRRRAEATMGELQTRNTAMLRAIPDLMFVLRCDGTYVDYHARDPKQLFVPAERFLGRTIRDIMPRNVADRLMTALERACASEEPVVIEYELSLDEPRHYEARLVHAGQDRVLSIVRDVTESKRAHEQNRNLAGQLIASQENERAHIARDLHDGVCQEVASVAVDASYLRQRSGELQSGEAHDVLLSLERRAGTVAETLRRLSHGLHPTVLHHIGLVAALQAHCAEVERQHHLQVRCFAEGDLEPASSRVALSLFRIAQEALRNTATHSHARRATVSLSRDAAGLMLVVADDGAGFDVAAARRNGGLGLVSIEERARMVHGQATIYSQPGHGTTIDVRVAADAVDRVQERTSPRAPVLRSSAVRSEEYT